MLGRNALKSNYHVTTIQNLNVVYTIKTLHLNATHTPCTEQHGFHGLWYRKVPARKHLRCCGSPSFAQTYRLSDSTKLLCRPTFLLFYALHGTWITLFLLEKDGRILTLHMQLLIQTQNLLHGAFCTMILPLCIMF